MRPRLGRKLLLTAVLTAGIVITGAGTALADGPIIGVGTGGGATPGGGGPGGGGGGSNSGGGGGGTGGGGSGPVAPPVTRIISDTVYNAQRAISAGCAPAQGDRAVIGRTITYRVPVDWSNGDLEGGYEGQNARYERLGTDCWYEPRYVDSDRTCILSSRAAIVQSVPQRRTLDTATRTTAFGAGDRTIANCESSTSRLDLNAVMDAYGRYEAEANSAAQRVTVRTWTEADRRTGRVPEARIIAYGSVYNISPDFARAQLDCTGYQDGWDTSRPWTWTEDDCGGGTGSGSGVQCLAPGTPSTTWRGSKGSSASRQVMGSGEPARITWARPQVTGSALVAVTSAQHRLALQGAPWRSDLPADANLISAAAAGSANSVLKSAEGSGWRAGDEASYDVAWYGATLDSTRLSTEYDYRVDVRRQSIRITGLSEDGRTFITERIDVVLPSRITCEGAPVNVDALRIVQDVAP